MILLSALPLLVPWPRPARAKSGDPRRSFLHDVVAQIINTTLQSPRPGLPRDRCLIASPNDLALTLPEADAGTLSEVIWRARRFLPEVHK